MRCSVKYSVCLISNDFHKQAAGDSSLVLSREVCTFEKRRVKLVIGVVYSYKRWVAPLVQRHIVT